MGGSLFRAPRSHHADAAVFTVFGVEVHAIDETFLLDVVVLLFFEDQGDQFPEPLFAILNFAKINDAAMTSESWTMEVDWVKHERRVQ